LREPKINIFFESQWAIFKLSPYNCVKREIEKEPCCFPFGRINNGPKTPNIRRNATMAQYHITLNDELLHGLFTRDEGL